MGRRRQTERQGSGGQDSEGRGTEGEGADFDSLPLVLTSAEAARVLRVGVREIRQLVDSGDLPAARLGPRRVIRIARSAVIAALGGEKAA